VKFWKEIKYQLAEDERFQTAFRPARDIVTDLIWLTTEGVLTIRRYYAWDGVSGPVVDRKSNWHAGCCHDALYELMRRGRLDHNRWRDADREFAKQLKKHGAWKITRQIDMAGLKLSHGKYAQPENRKKVFHV
jgi:hypothetical protein